MSYIVELDTTEQPAPLALRANNLAAVLKTYLPVFAQAVQNAAGNRRVSEEQRLVLGINHHNAETFLQAWRDHASGEAVTEAEFNGLRLVAGHVDDAVHAHLPGQSTLSLSVARFEFVGK